jgi:hypothetical protein
MDEVNAKNRSQRQRLEVDQTRTIKTLQVETQLAEAAREKAIQHEVEIEDLENTHLDSNLRMETMLQDALQEREAAIEANRMAQARFAAEHSTTLVQFEGDLSRARAATEVAVRRHEGLAAEQAELQSAHEELRTDRATALAKLRKVEAVLAVVRTEACEAAEQRDEALESMMEAEKARVALEERHTQTLSVMEGHDARVADAAAAFSEEHEIALKDARAKAEAHFERLKAQLETEEIARCEAVQNGEVQMLNAMRVEIQSEREEFRTRYETELAMVPSLAADEMNALAVVEAAEARANTAQSEAHEATERASMLEAKLQTLQQASEQSPTGAGAERESLTDEAFDDFGDFGDDVAVEDLDGGGGDFGAFECEQFDDFDMDTQQQTPNSAMQIPSASVALVESQKALEAANAARADAAAEQASITERLMRAEAQCSEAQRQVSEMRAEAKRWENAHDAMAADKATAKALADTAIAEREDALEKLAAVVASGGDVTAARTRVAELELQIKEAAAEHAAALNSARESAKSASSSALQPAVREAEERLREKFRADFKVALSHERQRAADQVKSVLARQEAEHHAQLEALKAKAADPGIGSERMPAMSNEIVRLNRTIRRLSHKMNVMRAVNFMSRGAVMKKFNFKNRKTDVKFVAYHPDTGQIAWGDVAKDPKKQRFRSFLPLQDIISVHFGPYQPTFVRMGDDFDHLPWNCLTLRTKERTYDFVTQKGDDCAMFTVGISAVSRSVRCKHTLGKLLFRRARMRIVMAADKHGKTPADVFIHLVLMSERKMAPEEKEANRRYKQRVALHTPPTPGLRKFQQGVQQGPTREQAEAQHRKAANLGTAEASRRSEGDDSYDIFTAKLKQFYEMYNPGRLGDVEKIAQAYHGKPAILNARLRETYDGRDLTTMRVESAVVTVSVPPQLELKEAQVEDKEMEKNMSREDSSAKVPAVIEKAGDFGSVEMNEPTSSKEESEDAGPQDDGNEASPEALAQQLSEMTGQNIALCRLALRRTGANAMSAANLLMSDDVAVEKLRAEVDSRAEAVSEHKVSTENASVDVPGEGQPSEDDASNMKEMVESNAVSAEAQQDQTQMWAQAEAKYYLALFHRLDQQQTGELPPQIVSQLMRRSGLPVDVLKTTWIKARAAHGTGDRLDGRAFYNLMRLTAYAQTGAEVTNEVVQRLSEIPLNLCRLEGVLIPPSMEEGPPGALPLLMTFREEEKHVPALAPEKQQKDPEPEPESPIAREPDTSTGDSIEENIATKNVVAGECDMDDDWQDDDGLGNAAEDVPTRNMPAPSSSKAVDRQSPLSQVGADNTVDGTRSTSVNLEDTRAKVTDLDLSDTERPVPDDATKEELEDGTVAEVPGPNDVECYRALFQWMDKAGVGELPAQQAAQVIKLTKLPPTVMKQVWRLATAGRNPGDPVRLQDFVKMLRLAALAQDTGGDFETGEETLRLPCYRIATLQGVQWDKVAAGLGRQ